MSFTVEDFHDLVELLAQHPEWRAELRRHVLSDELLELPSLVRQLVEAQTRTEARVRELAEAQARTETRLQGVEVRLDGLESAVKTLVEAQTRAEARLEGVEARLERVIMIVGELAEAQGRTETLVGRFADRLGDIDGRVLELDFARRGPAYLGPIARRLRVIEPGPLADLLDDAIDDGRLTWDERVAILLTDLVMTGRRRQDGEDVYLLVEVSGRIEPYDVERAAERAALLEKLGRPVVPVVAGRRIEADVADLAAEQGVWYALGGRVVPPRSA
jgi:hypothetical protein